MTPGSKRERYGPVALVTGASSGIGEQFARLLAARGFALLLTARRQPLLDELKTAIERDYGVTVHCQPCDLSDLDQVDALIARARSLEIGLLVSNAGYGVPKGDFLQADLRAMEAMYRTNSIAPARLAHALLPAMVARGRGGIIFTGSVEGDAVFPHSAAYAASKAFLHSLAMGLWEEVRGFGVDVLVLAPGPTDTEAPVRQGISKEQLPNAMDPAEVARQALDQLGRRPHFTPGLGNRLMTGLLRQLPRALAIRLTGYGMRRAIRNSRQ